MIPFVLSPFASPVHRLGLGFQRQAWLHRRIQLHFQGNARRYGRKTGKRNPPSVSEVSSGGQHSSDSPLTKPGTLPRYHSESRCCVGLSCRKEVQWFWPDLLFFLIYCSLDMIICKGKEQTLPYVCAWSAQGLRAFLPALFSFLLGFNSAAPKLRWC